MMNPSKELKEMNQNRDGTNNENNNSNLTGIAENNLILKLE